MTETVPSICRVCPAHCPILVTREGGRPLRVTGDPEAPLYGGYTCPKGRALPEQHVHPGRLLQSLRRGEDGGFAPVASGDAAREVAARVRAIVAESGPRAVAMYIGTNALPYPAAPLLATAWLRALGSRMLFTSNTIDQPGKQIAQALHGSWHAGAQGFETADTWLVVGQNPVISKSASVPSQNPGRKLKDAVARGMKLVVIDPRRSETARRAEVHLQGRPGEDPALLAALLRVLFEEGHVDDAFLAENAEGADALREAVAPFTPELAAARAGVAAGEIVRAARVLGAARRGGASCGTGPSFATHGTLSEYLALALCSVRGFWPRAGEPALRPNVMLPGFVPRAQPLAPYRAWGFGEKLRVRGLTNTAAGMPTAALAEEITTPGEGRVRALFCLGGNPMMAWPDQRLARRALASLDLLVTFDPELSATARLAHYVIAPRLTLETPGMTQPAENLKFFGPAVGYAEPYAQYSPAVASPPEGADVVEEWQFFRELAREMELPLHLVSFYGWGKHVESPPRVRELAEGEPATTDSLYEWICEGSRVPLAEVKRHPHGHVFEEARCTVQPRADDCEARLQLADPHMLAELAQVEAAPPADDPARPLLLVPRRDNRFLNSTGRSLASLHAGRPWNPLHVHPGDLEAAGLAAGDLARLRSAHDEIGVVVEPDATLRRGVVALTHAFGGLPGEDDDPRVAGSNAGRLLRVDDDFDPVSGIPRMGALPVALERA